MALVAAAGLLTACGGNSSALPTSSVLRQARHAFVVQFNLPSVLDSFFVYEGTSGSVLQFRFINPRAAAALPSSAGRALRNDVFTYDTATGKAAISSHASSPG